VVQALGQLFDFGSLRGVGFFKDKSAFSQGRTRACSSDCDSVTAAGAWYVTSPAGWSGRGCGCCDEADRHLILILILILIVSVSVGDVGVLNWFYIILHRPRLYKSIILCRFTIILQRLRLICGR
jgi:hypothetical protein